MAKELKRAFGLIRVSTSEQDTQSQKDQLKRIAEEKGYLIVDEREGHDFFSEKISGYDEQAHDRDSIVQLKEQLEIRRPDAIFCLELSRLTRRATKVSHYIEELSIKTGIPMYFADYDIWTFALNPKTNKIEQNDDGIMTLYGGARSVEIERERIRARTSRGRNAKAEKGYYVGHLKDGYRWVNDGNDEKIIVVDEQRREMIETIFHLYYEKEYSTAEIRDYLNAKNYPTTNKYRYQHPELFKGYKKEYVDKSGHRLNREDTIWMNSSVSSILKDEWYVGIRRYHKKPYPIPPIVSKEVWDGCQKRLSQYRTRISTAQQPYLLGGLMYCGNCGRKMYGHSDGGYNDMYYCSSYEYGTKNKCGLRWVRRQNIEAIVMNIIKRRVYADITLGEKSPFSDFFSIDGTKLSELDEKIKMRQSAIDRIDQNVEKCKGTIRFYMRQQGNYHDDEDRIAEYENLIDEEDAKIKEMKREKIEYEVAIDKLKKQKRMLASVKTKLLEMKNLEDYTRAKALFQSVIQRITLYNPDRTTTIIKIEYVNGKKDTAIYNPIRMKKKFIALSIEDWNDMDRYMQYDAEIKKLVFNGLYLAYKKNQMFFFNEKEDEETSIEGEIGETEGIARLGQWDTPSNRERFIKEAIAIGIDKKEAIEQYDMAVEQGLLWKDIDDAIRYYKGQGMKIYKDEMSVKEFVELKRNDTMSVYPFADLLPMSERAMELHRYHYEYGKRYNTGNKTSVPYIDKNADYEQILKKRKRLYNRKYKILKNKHLTQAQKDEQIFRIMEQLEAYKYMVKYLPTNKRGKDLLEKYGKGKTQ